MASHTRREFTKLALTGLTIAAGLAACHSPRLAEGPKPAVPKPAGGPNSKVNGVQIGLNVPYSFGNPAMSGEDILERCIQLGISGLELRAQPVESFLGVPADLVSTRRPAAAAGTAEKNAPVEPSTARTKAEELRQWRTSVSMDGIKKFRERYESAGVLIEILKIDNFYGMADSELDYFFSMAKTLGARAISCEISAKEEDLARIGRFADKHRVMVGYHGHAATTPAHWEHAFSLAKYNAANVDLGHFVAGNNVSPVAFIKQHYDRITHVHVKDRKMHEGPNTAFGQGDTPIVEVLRLIRDNRWNIQATIEFEYPVPAGSDRMTELARAVKYCREALA